MSSVPNQPHRLISVGLKLQRAHEQLQSLKLAIKGFLESKPYTFETQVNAETATIYQVVRVLRECPPIWSILIGEVVHDLRSALDYIRHQLVIHETGIEPPLTDKKGQFPIFLNESGFKSRGLPAMLKGVGVKAKALIESEQPFRTGEGTESPIWQLSELSNWDKHRAIPVTGGSVKSSSVEIQYSEEVISLSARPNGPFKDNTALAWVNLRPSSKPLAERINEVEMKGNFSTYICFDQPESVHGEKVLLCIAAIAERVNKIAERVDREILGA